MRISASRMTMREEWARSSWIRRSGALRSLYCALSILAVVVAANVFPEVRSYVPSVFKFLMVLFSVGLQSLVFEQVSAERRVEFSGSPNAYWLSRLLEPRIHDEWRNSENWKRWFFRVSIFTMKGFSLGIAILHCVALWPFLLIERAWLGSPTYEPEPQT